MINFIDIFQSSAEQARLITTLIAVISAILVVLLNQRFNSTRSRKDKLIEMIENLYEEIAKSNRVRLDIHYTVVTEYDKPECDEKVMQLHAEYLASLLNRYQKFVI